MERTLSDIGNAPSSEQTIHQFVAEGTAPFIKSIRNAKLRWTAAHPFCLHAKSGISEAGVSVSLLPEGRFQVSPFQATEITIAFKEPVYFLTVQKLFEIICRRYSLPLRLYSHWEVDVWPLFLEFFLQSGKWPSTVEDMRQLGASIVADFRRNSTPQLRRLPKLQRLSTQLPLMIFTRINLQSSIRDWAKKHWASVYRKFFKFPRFDEIEANAELLRDLRSEGEGLIALKSVPKEDDMAFAMPFNLATGDSLKCKNTIGIAPHAGGSAGCARTATAVQFDSPTVGPIPLPCRLQGDRAQVPLLSGAKRAYGAFMQAPIIVKGETVACRIEQNLPKIERRVKVTLLNFLIAGRSPHISENPADLCVTLRGHEA